MVDISFGESECGLLRFSLRTAFKGDSKLFQAKNDKEKSFLETLFVSPNKLNTKYISTNLGLEIGHISSNEFECARKKILDKFYFNWLSKKEIDAEYIKEMDRVNEIVELAKNGNHLRFWVANATYNLCGLYYILNKIKEYNCQITLVNLKSNIIDAESGKKIHYRSWGMVEPCNLLASIKSIKTLSKKEVEHLANEWVRLENKNADLRVVEKNKVVSVNSNYFDDLIFKYVPSGNFKEIVLIGKVLGNCNQYVNINQIAMRIDELIADGVFEIVAKAPNKEPEYNKVIRKVK